MTFTVCASVLAQGIIVLLTSFVTISVAALIVGLIERCGTTNENENDDDEKAPEDGWLFHKFINNVNQFKVASKSWVDSDGFTPVNNNIIVLLQFLLIYKDDLTFEQATYIIQALHDKLTKEAKLALGLIIAVG